MKILRSYSVLLLFLTAASLFIANLSLGNVQIPFSQIALGLSGQEIEKEIWSNIFYYFRLPRALSAVFVGVGLAVSGLQMQTLFRNPLAGPFVLGISSGASLGVAILVLASYSFGGWLSGAAISSWATVFAASLGSGFVFFIILFISFRIKDTMGLLIIGIMMASIAGSIVGFLQYFSSAEQIQVFLIWTFGSLGGIDWVELSVFIPVILAGVMIAFFMAKPLNAFVLGDNYAKSLGMNVTRGRILIIISTCILAGSVTAFAGPIAFIGLAVPHLTRMLFSTADHRKLLPLVALMGAIFLLICDIIAQLPGREEVLPINIVTSFVGAPVVIWIILKKRDIKKSLN